MNKKRAHGSTGVKLIEGLNLKDDLSLSQAWVALFTAFKLSGICADPGYYCSSVQVHAVIHVDRLNFEGQLYVYT